MPYDWNLVSVACVILLLSVVNGQPSSAVHLILSTLRKSLLVIAEPRRPHMPDLLTGLTTLRAPTRLLNVASLPLWIRFCTDGS